MLKKLNEFMMTSIITSILFLVVGIVFVINPEISLKTIFYIIGVFLIISGISFMLESSERLLFMSFLSMGVFQIVLGLIILIHPNLIKIIIPILIGTWIIIKSTIDLKFSFILKASNYQSWFFIFMFSILSIICGVIIIFNPEISTLAITKAFGLLVASYSVLNIIDAIIIKKNINTIAKELKIK